MRRPDLPPPRADADRFSDRVLSRTVQAVRHRSYLAAAIRTARRAGHEAEANRLQAEYDAFVADYDAWLTAYQQSLRPLGPPATDDTPQPPLQPTAPAPAVPRLRLVASPRAPR